MINMHHPWLLFKHKQTQVRLLIIEAQNKCEMTWNGCAGGTRFFIKLCVKWSQQLFSESLMRSCLQTFLLNSSYPRSDWNKLFFSCSSWRAREMMLSVALGQQLKKYHLKSQNCDHFFLLSCLWLHMFMTIVWLKLVGVNGCQEVVKW